MWRRLVMENIVLIQCESVNGLAPVGYLAGLPGGGAAVPRAFGTAGLVAWRRMERYATGCLSVTRCHSDPGGGREGPVISVLPSPSRVTQKPFLAWHDGEGFPGFRAARARR